MMNTWTPAEPGSASDFALMALARIIPHIGSRGFTSSALQEINCGLQAGSWSVYRTSPDAPPVCYLSDSYRRPDTTTRCFRAYRDGLYRDDRTFEALGERKLAILHLRADDVRHPGHRRMIYEQHGLRERLSAASRCEDGAILTVNLYRHDDQPGFRDDELRLFDALSHGLFALVERQIALGCMSADGGMQRDKALRRLAPDMPVREIEVCVRLLQGMSHDGIACDLGISVTTVKTYRNRAFARLGIHRNNELFAMVMGDRGGHASSTD